MRIETTGRESRDDSRAARASVRGGRPSRAGSRTHDRRIAPGATTPGARAVLTLLSLAILIVGAPIVTVIRSCEAVTARGGSKAA